MVDLVFRQHPPTNPPILFFWLRDRFMRNGSIQIVSGVVTDENGVTTTYKVVRTPSFRADDTDPYRTSQVDPNTSGLSPVNFTGGRVTLVSTSTASVLLTSSEVHQFVGGRIDITSTVDARGAISRFAVWADNLEDPVNFYVEEGTNNNSGNVGAAWTRHHATFVPHPNTRYLAVGAKVYSVPTGTPWRSQFFKKWMLEKAEIGATVPSDTYYPARELELVVKADRINYFPYPDFITTDIDELDPHSGETLDPSGGHLRAYRGSLRPDVAWVWTPSTPLPVGPWTVSFDVTGLVDQWVMVAGIDPDRPGDPLIYSDRTRVTANKNTRVGAVLTNCDPNAGIIFRVVADNNRPTTEATTFDRVLVENTAAVRPFFNGSSTGDTVWEDGGDPGESRSYLYNNRAARYASLIRALEVNVPMGVLVGEPLFGKLTTD